jgi:hypothetical protein
MTLKKNTRSIIVKEFYLAIKNQLKPLVIPKLTRNKIKEINVGFESLDGIPYILGAIDGNHIPIVAPMVDPKSHYCQKNVLLHIDSRNCKFKSNVWDYG